jgi:cyclopropane fatty-acyl-phospholipid synthase-like methyltransferase
MNLVNTHTVSNTERRVRDHYERLADQASLTRASKFMNIGYWRHHPATLDDAARALVRLVATEACIGPDDAVLDVGCGFGDQDILWAEEYGARTIDAVNISAYQLRAAAQLIAARHLSERIRLRLASATSLPFDTASFDKVLCVEAAHHFDTREAFFREAYRVLKPGGVFAAADILLRPGRRLGTLSSRMMYFPRANAYAMDGYQDRLRASGFTDVQVRPITEDVFAPFAQFLTRRFAARAGIDGAGFAFVRHGIARLILSATTRFDSLEFVIAAARRRDPSA